VAPKSSPKSRDEYFDDAWEARDAAEDRWLPLHAKVCANTASNKERVEELIAHAELYAGANHLGRNDPQAFHSREQRIDMMASLIAGFAAPKAGATDPEWK
jgi:hypothetical protein